MTHLLSFLQGQIICLLQFFLEMKESFEIEAFEFEFDAGYESILNV